MNRSNLILKKSKIPKKVNPLRNNVFFKDHRCINTLKKVEINSFQRSNFFSNNIFSQKRTSIEKQNKNRSFSSHNKSDVLIIGGGHNGLISGCYLAKKGLKVKILEKRSLIGGAAVTEEIFPGFKFSRASYLAGLLRPHIIKDLNLHEHGLEFISRDPSSFTPSKMDGPFKGKYLMLGDDSDKNFQNISQFSAYDASQYGEYEKFLGKVREILNPLIDIAPPNPFEPGMSLKRRMKIMSTLNPILKLAYKEPDIILPLYELFTAPATHILNKWFESEILKTTLATDAVIGSMASPSECGSAYVLLHHVMGNVNGKYGTWSYVKGGMGKVSESLEKEFLRNGGEVVKDFEVQEILVEGGKAKGVKGKRDNQDNVLGAERILSNANPYHTFVDLVNEKDLPPLTDQNQRDSLDFLKHIKNVDYSSGCMKINLAVDSLPNFECIPNSPSGEPGLQHFGTIHFENFISELEDSCREAKLGFPATRPIIEMTIPSALDDTIAPKGKHVIQLFIQGAPYNLHPSLGSWETQKETFSNRIFKIIDEYCPKFSKSIIHKDILTPIDLENIFSLKGGNIHHGAIGIHQIAYMRFAPKYFSYRTPIKNLYMCGAGAHPGGGVMGAPGHNCAMVVLEDIQKLNF